jgi:cob(I)alamin adenosyltransferase
MWKKEMSKLYTKKGDRGMTSLIRGRFSKGNDVFEALGEIDELSARIGDLCVHMPIENKITVDFLRRTQSLLINIGSEIASLGKKRYVMKSHTTLVEGFIDECEAKNSPLTVFLLPGSSNLNVKCHLCRTATRKVERAIVRIKGEIENNSLENILSYINRLSDYFFALSRNLGKDIKAIDVK